ncbi:MAG: hypothetical protein GXY33_19510 [Phycisphaerae bacterium]|nr:hypothetical protein [Phycisphaerae bacterium]
MANSGSEKNNGFSLGGINWSEAFPFTNLFRTFRLAIHPSKLFLALLAVLVCYIGGRFLDGLAGWVSDSHVVVTERTDIPYQPADEIMQFIQAPTAGAFWQWRDQAIAENQRTVAGMLNRDLNIKSDEALELAKENRAVDRLWDRLKEQRADAAELLEKRVEGARRALADQEEAGQLERAASYLRIALWSSPRIASKAVVGMTPQEAVQAVVVADPEAANATEEQNDAREDRQTILQAVQLADDYAKAEALEGLGVFQAALSYGILMFNSAIDSVLALEPFYNADFRGFEQTPTEPPGLVRTLRLAAQGLVWFAWVHKVYFIIYGLFCLLVWALAGGAICRIAALHATRDEKIPLSEAVAFAGGKFANFFAAPLVPVLFILGCCVFLLVGGLVGAIPVIGEIIVGILFVLALLLAFVLALLVVGAVGGVGLMYPVIAVEGSDAFDAFSRSYSYVYHRPWRTIFYYIVAAIYGTLCFVFVKLFVGLIFIAASSVVGTTMNLDSASLASPLGKLEAIWYSPSLAGPFFGQFFVFPLGSFEWIGGVFIAFWVYLLVGLVIGFAISFLFCALTIMYLLLRQKVDATDLEEVYVEEFESEPVGAEAPPATPGEPEAAPEAPKAENLKIEGPETETPKTEQEPQAPQQPEEKSDDEGLQKGE